VIERICLFLALNKEELPFNAQHRDSRFVQIIGKQDHKHSHQIDIDIQIVVNIIHGILA